MDRVNELSTADCYPPTTWPWKLMNYRSMLEFPNLVIHVCTKSMPAICRRSWFSLVPPTIVMGVTLHWNILKFGVKQQLTIIKVKEISENQWTWCDRDLTSVLYCEVFITPFLEVWIIRFTVFVTGCFQGLVKMFHILDNTKQKG